MPRSSSTNELIRQQRKQTIIEIAIELFATNGIEQTSIDSITKSCNISHGLFYHYFKNKNDLLDEVMKTVVNYVFNRIDFSVIKKDPVLAFKKLYLFIDKSLKTKRGTFFMYIYLSTINDKKMLESITNDALKENQPFGCLLSLFKKLEEINAFTTKEDHKVVMFLFISAIIGICNLNIQSNFSFIKYREKPTSFMSFFIKRELLNDKTV